MCYIMISLSGNEMIYMGIWVQPYRPAPSCDCASALCLSPRPQMCFFQTLRPTESHSQTPSYWGTNKPSQNFFSAEQRTHKNNEQTIRTRRDGETHTVEDDSAFTFVVTKTEPWTARADTRHVTAASGNNRVPFVLDKKNCSIRTFWLLFIGGIQSLWITPPNPPKRMSFPLASGLYCWSEMAESWAATSRYQSAHE